MTGHLVVPALDELPATSQPADPHWPPSRGARLRGARRHRRARDARDQRRSSVWRRAPSARSRRAPTRSASATTCTRTRSSAVLRAIVSGRARRRVCRSSASRKRPAESARRHAGRRAPSSAGAPGRALGARAAQRALRARDTPSLVDAPLVIELVAPANVAVGRANHGLADLWPGAIRLRLTEPMPEPQELLTEYADRGLVVVVRDAARHEWQAGLARELVALRPDAVVVETGLPGGIAATVETGGAGKANLEAACALLRADGSGRSGSFKLKPSPLWHARRRVAASSVAPVSLRYGRSLRPCHTPPIAPDRRGVILNRALSRRGKPAG